jgi:tRNA pseudouridine55 synthase
VVTIHHLKIVSFEYPTLALDIECGSGTYIRALGRDLAESLGTAAVMSALERTAVGSFRVEDACDPAALTAETLPTRLLSPLKAIPSLPVIQLSDAQIELTVNGIAVTLTNAQVASAPPDQEFAAVDSIGELVSILRRRTDGALAPALNFRKASSG